MAYSTGSGTQTSMTLSSGLEMDKETDQCLITLEKGGRSTAEAQVWMKMARNGLFMALECLDEQVTKRPSPCSVTVLVVNPCDFFSSTCTMWGPPGDFSWLPKTP